MLRALISAIGFCTLCWSATADDDEVSVPNGGGLQQITCVVNMGNKPIPASSVSYEVGVVKTDEESKSTSLEDMHSATVSLSYKYGFSELSSIEMSASYTYEHKETTTTSQMTSSTVSEKLTLSVPEVDPGSTWCAYRLESMSWPSSQGSKINFMFKDIIVTDQKLNLESADLIIRGKKQIWDDPRGYLAWTLTWGSGDNGWFMYMQDNGDGNVRGWQGDPGDQGHLLFTRRYDETTYLLSTKKWPNWYLYMQDVGDGNVRGWDGDPGPQGHFLIKGHPFKNCYLISTEQWPGWYMYMQDVDDGNIRGWEGDPGDQGCWDMVPSYTRLALNTSVLVV